VFAGKKSAQIREILISESAWEEMTCLFAPSLAEMLGRVGAARAVGAANGSNPVSIVVPCHRVIGRNGTLTGYAGGVQRKEWLLRHEGYLLL